MFAKLDKTQKPTVPSTIVPIPSPEVPTVPCQHLTGPKYTEYILRTQTRLLGGISYKLRAWITRQLFMYKPFPAVKDFACGKESQRAVVDLKSVPWEANCSLKEKDWTNDEQKKLDASLLAWARWEVDYVNGYVCLSQCERRTSNKSGICDACEKLALSDQAFKHAIRRVCKAS